METVSKWLTDIRRKQHLSLRGAASQTGLSYSTIASIEQGVRPSFQTIKMLAWGFGGRGPGFLPQGLALFNKLMAIHSTTILITKPNGDEIQIHNSISDNKAFVYRCCPCACFLLGPVVVELLIRHARQQGWKVREFRSGEFYRYKKLLVQLAQTGKT